MIRKLDPRLNPIEVELSTDPIDPKKVAKPKQKVTGTSRDLTQEEQYGTSAPTLAQTTADSIDPYKINFGKYNAKDFKQGARRNGLESFEYIGKDYNREHVQKNILPYLEKENKRKLKFSYGGKLNPLKPIV